MPSYDSDYAPICKTCFANLFILQRILNLKNKKVYVLKSKKRFKNLFYQQHRNINKFENKLNKNSIKLKNSIKIYNSLCKNYS